MKKMDEMERNIQLRAEEWGYKAVMAALAVWTFFNIGKTLMYGEAYHPLPGLVLCFAVCIQGLSQAAMKRKMIAGDEEYHEPNRLLWGIIGIVIITAAMISIGTYFIMKVQGV